MDVSYMITLLILIHELITIQASIYIETSKFWSSEQQKPARRLRGIFLNIPKTNKVLHLANNKYKATSPF